MFYLDKASARPHGFGMAGQKTLRIGIIGAARVAVYAMIAPAKENARVEVVSVAARDPARAEAFALEHRIPGFHVSYEALMNDPRVDLVYIATPPSVHAAQTIAALRAGKPVFCEKPFTSDAREAAQVMRARDVAGLRVIEAFHYRHHALWTRILDLIRDGAVGRIVSIDASFHVPIAKSADEFRWNPALGGGALMDLGCYPLQWVRTVTGEEPKVARAAMRMVDGVDAETTAELAFPGGARATISCGMEGTRFEAQMKIDGTAGSIRVLNPLAPQLGHLLEVTRDGVTERGVVDGPSTYAAQLSNLVATLCDGADYPLEKDDPLHSMAAIDAVRVAVR